MLQVINVAKMITYCTDQVVKSFSLLQNLNHNSKVRHELLTELKPF